MPGPPDRPGHPLNSYETGPATLAISHAARNLLLGWGAWGALEGIGEGRKGVEGGEMGVDLGSGFTSARLRPPDRCRSDCEASVRRIVPQGFSFGSVGAIVSNAGLGIVTIT